MKKTSLLSIAILLSTFIFCGATCRTNPATSVYQTENLIADSTKAAVHTFNVYYAQQTATNPASADLESAKKSMYDADRQIAKTLAVVDALRLNYTSNPAQTNQSAMFIALQAASDQSSNIVTLVKQYVGK